MSTKVEGPRGVGRKIQHSLGRVVDDVTGSIQTVLLDYKIPSRAAACGKGLMHSMARGRFNGDHYFSINRALPYATCTRDFHCRTDGDRGRRGLPGRQVICDRVLHRHAPQLEEYDVARLPAPCATPRIA